MSKVDRSTPLDNFDDLLPIYETTDRNAVPIYNKVSEMQHALQEVLLRQDLKELGVVMSVEGTWGSGKTTFINLALEKLAEENVVIVKYDSLFYGNVSEATSIFISDIFKTIRNSFGIELRENGIAKNISPKFEVGSGLPKLSFDLKLDSRNPTELIKNSLADKLKKLNGKVVVVIDDLDRVSANDVVHFLRIVRVLRELPNFIVILPIDKRALEDLLASINVASPRKYLEKIIDWSIGLDPEIPTARTLLVNKVKNNISANLDDSSVDEMWKMILLELALTILDTEDIREVGALLGTGKSEQPAQKYERKAKSVSAGNNSLMRGFIDRTSRVHGASYNLVTQVTNDSVPNSRFYRSYTNLYGSQNFVDFIRGLSSTSLASPEHLADSSQNFIITNWYRDIDYLVPTFANGQPNEAYEVQFPNNPQGIQPDAFNTQMESTSISLWNELKNLVEAYYPEQGLYLLAPRTINKIVAAFEYQVLESLLSQPINNDRNLQMSLYAQVSAAVKKALQES
jgi:hypothetical protein